MPQLDKTGPMGQGAQTGRKQGQCICNTDTTEESTWRGKGRIGRGFGYRGNNNSENLQEFGRGRIRGLGRGQNRMLRND